MALVTASWTYPTVEKLTRQNVLERFLRETGLGIYGTVVSGSTSTLVDTSLLQNPQWVPEGWIGAWERIGYNASGAGAAPETEVRTIQNFEPGAGRITLATVHTAAPAVGDEYQLYRSIHPQFVLDTIDQILKNDAYLPCWSILTECPDGDMEQNNTTDWSSTNATLSKVTSEPGMTGTRYMAVTNTSANGYCKSATLNVQPGKAYHLSALVRCSSAGSQAQLYAYDETNAATVAGTTVTSSSYALQRLWTQFTAPSTCYKVTIRFGGVGASDVTDWDQVCFFSLEATDIALPWWVRHPDQVKGIFRMRPWDIAANTWDGGLRGEVDDNVWDFRDEAFGRNQLRIYRRQGPIIRPMFIFGSRNETAYSDDTTDVKHVDANWMQAILAYRVFRQLMVSPNAGALDMAWVREQRDFWKVEWERENRAQNVRRELAVQSDAPDQFYYRQLPPAQWAAPTIGYP